MATIIEMERIIKKFIEREEYYTYSVGKGSKDGEYFVCQYCHGLAKRASLISHSTQCPVQRSWWALQELKEERENA
jgi:hypothetical protein